MTVNKERVELFAAALESDKYKQCTGQLKRKTFDLEQGYRYLHCALGVAVEVALLHEPALRTINPNNLWGQPYLHEAVAAWYGFGDDMVTMPVHPAGGDWVGGWNDEGASFWEIAQGIRAQYLKGEGQ